MKHPELNSLQRIIGHRFADMALLATAVTHRSFGAHNNERLEFLGDAILNFCIADALFQRFATASEGDLSRLRAALVKGETLAAIARELELGNSLRLGDGELRSGGADRDSILADAVEAVIGAIYLDAGMDVVRQRIVHWFRERLAGVDVAETGKDPKTRLQEYMQARGEALPEYEVVDIAGQAHAQHFTVECRVKAFPEPTIAEAANRRSAEKLAAEKMLRNLNLKIKG